MPKTTTLYTCQVCGNQYSTEQDAITCETQPPEPRLAEVGDIVTGQPIFGWFDGDVSWVVDPKAPRGDMAFYYVVAYIDFAEGRAHRLRYHLLTKAMTGKRGYRGGFTFNEGHISVRKVAAPPAQVASGSKDLIGQQAKYLL